MRILSGIKPTGIATLGNYIGALKNFVELQKLYQNDEIFMFIADLHSINSSYDTKELNFNIKSLAAIYLACGLQEKNLNLFIQSEVEQHSMLSYALESITYMGELERMIQYKEKKSKDESSITSALFTYPVLMAADILLYDANYVPVGDDQKQHLEITRDIGMRFNNRFGETFVIPQPLLVKTGTRIMDLQDPLKKMSKSDTDNKGCIFLLDDLKLIEKKIKSATTDSQTSVKFDKDNKPGISNLMTIYSALTNLSFEEITKKYHGLMYGDFKKDLASIVVEEIGKIQIAYNEIINSDKLDIILDRGRINATKYAKNKMIEVYKRMGLGR